MMGTQPAPGPPLSQGSSGDRDFYPVPQVTNSAPLVTNFVNSQSPMPMSSSTSEQFMSEMAENSGPDKKGAHNRSVSEPDFKRKEVGYKAYDFLYLVA